MYKPQNLRSYLLQASSELARDPDKLHLFVDEGRVVATATPGLSFEYHYVLNLIVTDIGLDLDLIFVPLLAWMRVHQRDAFALPAASQRGIRFEVDMTSATTLDLSIRLALTERTLVHRRDGGHLEVTHAAEPQLKPPFEDARWQLHKEGQVLAEWSVPALP